MYYGMAHNNLGQAAMNLDEPVTAMRHYREALRVFPGGYWAHRNLGNALYRENRVEEAIVEWNATLGWQPKDSEAHCNLGVALSRKRHYRDAAGHFERAVELKGDYWFARSQWAWLLATCPSNDVRNGQRALALAEPLVTVAGPQSPRALDILAAAYAETGDFSNAVSTVLLAIALTPDPASSESLVRRLNLYRSQKPYRE
jgi:tetratricopeptide (TPR) repeat protein